MYRIYDEDLVRLFLKPGLGHEDFYERIIPIIAKTGAVIVSKGFIQETIKGLTLARKEEGNGKRRQG